MVRLPFDQYVPAQAHCPRENSARIARRWADFAGKKLHRPVVSIDIIITIIKYNNIYIYTFLYKYYNILSDKLFR